jgi:hypothetical protein
VSLTTIATMPAVSARRSSAPVVVPTRIWFEPSLVMNASSFAALRSTVSHHRRYRKREFLLQRLQPRERRQHQWGNMDGPAARQDAPATRKPRRNPPGNALDGARLEPFQPGKESLETGRAVNSRGAPLRTD